MDYKKFIAIFVIAMAFVIPAVSADHVWRNGNYISNETHDQMIQGATVIYNKESGVESIIRDNNPANTPEVWMSENACLYGSGHLRSGMDRVGVVLTIANILSLNETQPLDIFGNGEYTFPLLAKGDYMLTLTPPDSTYGPVQYARVHCDHGTSSQVDELLGYAVTQSDDKCKPSYTIKEAIYGLDHCSNIQVVDVPSHTEYRYVTGFDRVCEDVRITEYRVRGHWDSDWSYQKGWHYDWDHSNSWSRWNEEIPERYNDIPSGDRESRSVTKSVCHNEKIWSDWFDISNSRMHFELIEFREVPATYTTECQHDGDVIDVTKNVQQVVASGYTSFVFDNSYPHTGIYTPDLVELLSEIQDPSVGNVKDVVITYDNGCGTEMSIKTKEYCTIDVVSGKADCQQPQ